MKPDEVPEALVDDAVDGWHAAPSENGKHTVLLDDVMRHALAAAMPSYEALVRAKVSAEILAERDRIPDATFLDRIRRTAMVLAARIALNDPAHPEEAE